MAHINDNLRQTADGIVHGVNPSGGGEHTLCGIAYDADVTERESAWEIVDLAGDRVTCAFCVQVVEACKKMRTLRKA